LPCSFIEKIQQLAIAGTPDFLCCISGWFVALELKRSAKEKPTKLQQYKLDRISKAGGISLVVSWDNWEKVIYFLEDLCATHKRELSGDVDYKVSALWEPGRKASS
jgi:hypothetical protein